MITSPHITTDAAAAVAEMAVETAAVEVSRRETTSAVIETAINNRVAAVAVVSTGLSLTISKMMISEIAADIVL